MKRHVAHAKKTAEVDSERHIIACEDLAHLAKHGDVSLCKHLYDTLGGAISAQRTATLKAWFVLMSGNQLTAEKGEWKLKKGWTADKFTLDVAEDKPYWTLGGEKAPANLSLEAFLGTVKGYIKKIDNAVKEDRFQGDAEKVKAIVNSVLMMAEEKAKRLTAQEAGKVVLDAILEMDSIKVPGAILAAHAMLSNVASSEVTETKEVKVA